MRTASGSRDRSGTVYGRGAIRADRELGVKGRRRQAEAGNGAAPRAHEFDLAVPTGFEPAISSLTGTYARPLHHGTIAKVARFGALPSQRPFCQSAPA